MEKRSHALAGVLGVLFAGLAVRVAPAMWTWLLPTDWPVERLIENLERQVAEHPDDADLHYNLGRVHGYAFAFETEVLGASAQDMDHSPVLAQRDVQEFFYGRSPGSPRALARARPAPDEILRHLRGALERHLRAVALAPDRAEIHLGLAYVLEHGRHLGNRLDTAPIFALLPARSTPDLEKGLDVVKILQRLEDLGSQESNLRATAFEQTLEPELLERSIPYLDRERNSTNVDREELVRRLLHRYWTQRAIAAYRRAYELGIAADLADSQIIYPAWMQRLTSYEAGEGFLRLATERGMAKEEYRKDPAPRGVSPRRIHRIGSRA